MSISQNQKINYQLELSTATNPDRIFFLQTMINCSSEDYNGFAYINVHQAIEQRESNGHDDQQENRQKYGMPPRQY